MFRVDVLGVVKNQLEHGNGNWDYVRGSTGTLIPSP